MFYEVISPYVILHIAEDLYRMFSNTNSERHTKICFKIPLLAVLNTFSVSNFSIFDFNQNISHKNMVFYFITFIWDFHMFIELPLLL